MLTTYFVSSSYLQLVLRPGTVPKGPPESRLGMFNKLNVTKLNSIKICCKFQKICCRALGPTLRDIVLGLDELYLMET